MSTEAKGGKVSKGEVSAEYAAELLNFQRFKCQLNACPPVKSEADALRVRRVWVGYQPALRDSFLAIGLAC